MESYLQGRMDMPVQVTFTEVPSRAAVQQAVPVPPAPRLRNATDLLGNLDWKGVESLWPSSFQGTYLGASVVLDRAGGAPRLLLRYLAPADLDPAAQEVLKKGIARILDGQPDRVGFLRVDSILPPLPLSPPPSPSALLAWREALGRRLLEAGAPLGVEVRLVLPPRVSSPARAGLEQVAREVLGSLSGEGIPLPLPEPVVVPSEPGLRNGPSLQFTLRPQREVTEGGSGP
ncbi:MAG: hypothetical protein ACP5VN_07565 [Acidobacteriota bacterium]